MAPTDRSMPPAMITIDMPTAMIAMKLVSLASWARFCALRNLFFSIESGTRSPAASVVKTRCGVPSAPLSKTGMATRPLNQERRPASARMTRTSPLS